MGRPPVRSSGTGPVQGSTTSPSPRPIWRTNAASAACCGPGASNGSAVNPGSRADTVTYNAVAHPEQSASSGLLISYNVNFTKSGGNWTESAWAGSGSVCSAFITQPAWQTALGSGYTSLCGRRIDNDVSAVADPGTGVAVYDTFNAGGWLVFGGTSASAPIIGAVYALAGELISVNSSSTPRVRAVGEVATESLAGWVRSA